MIYLPQPKKLDKNFINRRTKMIKMKKMSLLFGLVVILALVLSACTANNNNMKGTETMEATDGVLGLTDDDVFGDVADEGIDNMDTEETAAIPETGNTMTDTPEPVATKDLSGADVIPKIGSVDTGRLSNLMDYEIVTMDNEDVGEIGDFIIDLDKQKIDYALVDVGGFLGIGEKEIAVPFSELTLATTENDALLVEGRESVFTYPGDVAKFENAPEFDNDDLPGLNDGEMDTTDWDLDLENIWGNDEDNDMDETVNIPANRNLHGITLASELIGLQVLNDVDTTYNDDNTDDEGIGTLTDIFVDPQTGTLQYLVIQINTVDIVTPRYAPVPLYAPYAPYAYYDDDVALVISSELLGNAPYFDEDSFPVTTEAGWDDEFDTYWSDLQ
jgi:sporulation protein YlmC with PRC-barrel domain/predicted small secreted protein